MDKIKTDKKTLRSFALTMALCFAVFAGILASKDSRFVFAASAFSLFFLSSSFTVPVWLRPLYVVWMKLAFVLGWLNMRILLCVFFYAVLTPVGLLMRFLGKDPLEKKFRSAQATYWKPKEEKRPSREGYERQS